MAQPSSKTIELAKNLREDLAGTHLPRSFGKLYSQHTRLSANQPGISWEEAETHACLNDAMRLLEAAFIEREAGIDNWHDSARRASELLEWLAHPQLNSNGLPLRLLSAAAYQLAGYPARSSGLLNEDTTAGNESQILRFLLKAEFPNLLEQLTQYWATTASLEPQVETYLSWHDNKALSDEVQRMIVKETASSLGVLCAEMRWGDEDRLNKALDKLNDIGKILLHDYDAYSWFLAKLCAEVSSIYTQSSLRHHVKALWHGMSDEGKIALDRYLRQGFQINKVLAWPSQVRGIEQLIKGGSFALVTPTGSGKTTVAEIAILQSLFLENVAAPLALYLVPSRALATEVETKLAKVLTTLNEPPIVVTGLYGGTDWGPTDVWLTTEQPTILICTYEKAEALIRFIGPLFLHRISLIIIDEAHLIQFEGVDKTPLRTAESRALRLESLGTRLFTYLDQSKGKVIALSAMASTMEKALAQWIIGQTDASPVRTTYRSTRQLIGRLECLPNRRFRIFYDLLDGATLQLQDEKSGKSDTPYIPNPFQDFPAVPRWEDRSGNQGSEKRLRPYLFWAAMQLASPDEKGKQRAVLISVTQNISGYAEDFLTLLNSAWETTVWKTTEVPVFFQQPTDPEKLSAWVKCLRSCEDYFGRNSREYRLLEKGIVVHHGRMPGLMARFLTEVIQERIVHLVLATSTLSEGVNLPFETILIPSLRRRTESISAREFGNLVGRAGRPGFGTEGRSLVLLEPEPASSRHDEEARKVRNARRRYFDLVDELARGYQINNQNTDTRSPLAALLLHLEEQWQTLTGSRNRRDFLKWLEQTAPLTVNNETPGLPAYETLDSLDSVLLSAIVELEQLANEELTADELEKRLQQIWQRSYAHYAFQEEPNLSDFFVQRGRALVTNIYPNSSQRRQLYRTNLLPRSGNQLLIKYPQIIEQLKLGESYATWSTERRLEYVQAIVDLLKSLPSVGISEYVGRGQNPVPWQVILRWWLTSKATVRLPSDISVWHKFVSDNFVYRFNWGLGSVLSLAMDKAHEGMLIEPSLENWPQIGLPWIVLWLKELIIWGTLEPVAAYLLAKGIEVTRTDAEEAAKLYYNAQSQDQTPNELLNASVIRDWAAAYSKRKPSTRHSRPPASMEVRLLRDFSQAQSRQWKVVPVEVEKNLYWFDLAGFPLAVSQRPQSWRSDYFHTLDFILDSFEEVVLPSFYI